MPRRLALLMLVALVLAPVAEGAERPRLTEEGATAIFLEHPKVEAWLDRYPEQGRTTDATYARNRGAWETGVWWGEAGQIAKGLVDDRSGAVTEAWTGPQVAWTMARGYKGAFGGNELERLPIWLGLCALFLVVLAGFRVGLNLVAERGESSTRVIDVGYAGVIGAHRIANGEAPYGHMPVQGNLTKCGASDAEGEVRDRIQTNG